MPVIMITAYGDADTRRKAIEGGAAGLFTKPIDFPELRGEIGRRLEAVAGRLEVLRGRVPPIRNRSCRAPLSAEPAS